MKFFLSDMWLYRKWSCVHYHLKNICEYLYIFKNGCNIFYFCELLYIGEIYFFCIFGLFSKNENGMKQTKSVIFGGKEKK